ncbi:MAG: helix-turn-helix domain-containing protein [Pirellula sp.]|nr:helix-turn-helix domain-containing protein [Pirellula sp.]
MMETNKRKALVAAGWAVGDAADFLEMSEAERQLLDARAQMAAAVREARTISNLSQKELGKRLNTSQPRIAKIERAAPDVSLDQLIRAFVAAGGRLDVQSSSDNPKAAKRKSKTAAGKVAKRFILESSASK